MIVADSRVIRHSSEAGGWELVLRPPDPRLQPYVGGDYEGYVETTATRIRRREVPNGLIPVIINLGSAWDVDSPEAGARASLSLDSFAAGLHDSYTIVESRGAAACLQVNFTPLGGYLFFGLPMHAMANRSTDLVDLLGPLGRELPGRLADAPDWATRFDILDDVIASRLAAGRPPSPAVAWAWGRLRQSAGRVAIGDLAGELGWSRKQLIAQFREQLGLPPKAVARVLRFRRAMELLGREGGPGWAEIAYSCGYYDQAHFNRDFREFTGVTPGQLLRERIPEGGLVIG